MKSVMLTGLLGAITAVCLCGAACTGTIQGGGPMPPAAEMGTGNSGPLALSP